MSLSAIVERLRALVACDTQNPPRQIDGDAEIFALCRAAIGDRFKVQTWDHGDGRVSWFAVRGRPKLLFNVHLDTVPAGGGWTSNPLELRLENDRAYGRGSCDIKGAAAVLLCLVDQGADNLALLFTTDEEGAEGCCVERFLDSGLAGQFEQVVVAEPTECRAVLGHRGFLSVKTRFRGVPGHSSEARALDDSAVHQLARWSAASLDRARRYKSSADDPGSCINMGEIRGGTKSNVIAGEAWVHWSARLKPGESNDDFLDEIKKCVPPGAKAEWEVPFAGEPLPASGQDAEAATEFTRQAGLPVGDMVDFWTEASLFSAAGLPALVLGPGSIRQAHVTDEWVALSQLETAYALYGKLVKSDG